MDMAMIQEVPNRPAGNSAYIWQFRSALPLLGGRGLVKINFQLSGEKRKDTRLQKTFLWTS